MLRALRGGIEPRDTFGSVMARNRGSGPGFDFLRYSLSVAVLLSHLSWLTAALPQDAAVTGHSVKAAAAISSPHWYGAFPGATQIVRLTLVPAFFALSGFLVTGSALRLRRVTTFLAFRALRIIPALSMEVVLSALAMGPILTTFSLDQYFRDPLLATYLLNILGHPQYSLPGLFLANPVNIVNGNLWTLPSEFLCYAIVSLLIVSKAIYRQKVVVAGCLLVISIFIVGSFSPDFVKYTQGISVFAPTIYFFTGVAAFHFKDKIPVRGDLFIICAISSALLLTGNSHLLSLAPVPLTYCTISIGMYHVPSYKFLTGGDYSYGLYLYGAPITQALIAIYPRFVGHVAYIAVPALVITYIFAFASWHLIEKHALRLKLILPERFFPRHTRIVPQSVALNLDDTPDQSPNGPVHRPR